MCQCQTRTHAPRQQRHVFDQKYPYYKVPFLIIKIMNVYSNYARIKKLN